MNNQLDNTKVANGNLIPVANLKRAPQELRYYILLYVEDINGNNETPLLLTAKELDKSPKVVLPLKQVAGRLYPVRIYGRDYFAIKTVDWDKRERVLLVSEKKLQRWIARANKNPEDIPTKKWWDDLMD